ncbi:MAG: histidine kinase [Aerococcaceae bacterium]|nr:histidine kinase [Aerococcaceae bacterium]
MYAFIEKTWLALFCYGVSIVSLDEPFLIVPFLVVYSSCLLIELVSKHRALHLILIGAFALGISFHPVGRLYTPLLIYMVVERLAFYGIPTAILLLLVPHFAIQGIGILAIYLAFRTQKEAFFHENALKKHDHLTLDKLRLRQQQLQLETDALKHIELAKLEERQHISRQLHDTIGHLVSSSILQLEALQIISTEKMVQERLATLSERMQDGMTDIRQTLHQLYDESFDLEQRISELLAPFPPQQAVFHYAIQTPLDLSFKVDVLSMVKELITNYQKHSNSPHFKLALIEQPAFYTLSYQDDGTFHRDHAKGIGLLALQETVHKYQGHLTLHTQNGFGVHLTLMKGAFSHEKNYTD